MPFRTAIRLRRRTFKLPDRLTFIALSFAFATPALAQTQAAQDADVRECTYVSRVEGSSGYGKTANWKDFARHSALRRAEKMGATHVVWERFVPVGAFNGMAIGRSYACKS